MMAPQIENLRDHRLLILPEFDRLRSLFFMAPGMEQLKDAEVAHLCWLGAQAPAAGRIVEIGSYKGKSALCLASGARSVGSGAMVLAVDLWLLGAGSTAERYNSEQTWQTFQKRVRDWGFDGQIVPFMRASVDAAEEWGKRQAVFNPSVAPKINVLFLDGGHTYADVHADFCAWSPFVAPGGHVAFHDYGTKYTDGVDRVVAEEVMGKLAAWGEFGVEGRIFTARRLNG